MKTTLRTLHIGILLAVASIASAQQVNTLYFLENAPMRHTINPAFQPTSNFYLTFPVIGYTSFWAGTNTWTMSDFIFKGKNGNTITPFHPDAPADWLERKPEIFSLDADFYTNILSFGFRIKENGYFHFNISEHLYMDAGISSAIFGINHLNTTQPTTLSFGTNMSAYTDIALGYSHKINDHWTLGGKLKVLVGQANLQAQIDKLTFMSTTDSIHVSGNGHIYAAAPLRWQNMPTNVNEFEDLDLQSLLFDENATIKDQIMEIIRPAGLGAAFDLGATYKPIKNLQITASVTDLGFIRWSRHAKAELSMNHTFKGVDLQFTDLAGDTLEGAISNVLAGFTDGFEISDINNALLPGTKMLTANLNVGIDANFWKNRIGIGVYSRTRFYNNRITEEVTVGAALRPANWFQLAASYSLINGRSSNMGAALLFAPYDGLMLTLATDYVPLTYAKTASSIGDLPLPYKTPGVNLSFGIAIVAGTNHHNKKEKNKDKDKDGIIDKLDMCPNTPLNVSVDATGCPLDSDGDGIADYTDECPDTPSAAYGLIDSVGCPLDSDNDSVYDYIDQCPNTPADGVAHVDSLGCLLDSDGDGVYDYIDMCLDTPEAAHGMVDSLGCPLDSDSDGVYDYMDQCPNTPAEGIAHVDANGCLLDSDQDGIFDYCDKCLNTVPEARNHVDSVGCALDTDGDGVYDYEDECPTVVGVKQNKGCPEVKREIRNLLNKAMSGIQFENGKATIKTSSHAILNDIAKVFIDNPTYMVEIQGHTDNVGKYSSNVELSERRANAVRAYLIKQGVPAARLTAHGYGPDVPIADNDTVEGRLKNRRVEFNITFEEITYETVYDRVQTTDSLTTK